MDWSHYSIPAMQLEARFGDRVVPAFCERPKSIWAMVEEAASSNPDGEALVCAERRMTWREVAQQSASVAAGLGGKGPVHGGRGAGGMGGPRGVGVAVFAAAPRRGGVGSALLTTPTS